jgi:2-polyprenyl-3-methyl-5-hydroxy-6-metoxy-1,4-benzoquinol methylase
MQTETTKTHWEKIYTEKQANEVSWTQDVPETSLSFINSFNLDKSAAIIDIGGGDSKLADHLLKEGFENITVLDISEAALEKAKKRLGNMAEKVTWVVADINDYKPQQRYDVWHDRAAFHFLTTKNQIVHYLSLTEQSLSKNGYITIGTFSENGPDKCSGLPVKKYSEKSLSTQLNKYFQKIKCINEDHITPFKTKQNFLFCSFRKKVHD